MSKTTSVPRSAMWLGLSGLIPFASLAVLVWLLPEERGWLSPVLTGYGVVILSFMGGCRWGLAAAGMGDGAAFGPLAVSVIPALYAWVVALMPDAQAQMFLAVGLMALLVADLRLTRFGGAPTWWPSLRWPLSIGAAGSLLAGAAAIT
ncbi:MAG: DUF3429 domain-containing protein [Pseudomonadota bacterium]